MDVAALVGIVERKHRVRLDADDSMFLLATVLDTMLAEARRDLEQVVAKAMDQASAANVQAEAAARAKAEAIVTQAGEWAGKQIRQAGEDAAKQIAREKQGVAEQVQTATKEIRVFAWIVCCSTALNVCAVLAFWLLPH